VKDNAGAECFGIVLSAESVVLHVAVLEDAPVEESCYGTIDTAVDLDLRVGRGAGCLIETIVITREADHEFGVGFQLEEFDVCFEAWSDNNTVEPDSLEPVKVARTSPENLEQVYVATVV
jgi:hypothetical protein